MSVSSDLNQTRQLVRQLRKRATDLGLRDEELKTLLQLDPSEKNYKTFTRILKAKLLLRKSLASAAYWKCVLLSKTVIVSVLVLIAGFFVSSSFEWDFRAMVEHSLQEPCIITLPPYTSELLRPRVPCGICKDLKGVPVVHNISREEFTDSYAYTGVPVLIKGAMAEWGALHSFDYQYFKSLYTESKESLENVDKNCQFFRYQTEFETLGEVFDMSDDRAALKKGSRPWYIGWSNCDSASNDVGTKLRAQYSRPYFLPRHSSNMDTDWIFMGGPGFGAGMHIDYVERPSWQAQVSGSKTWILDPSPECWNECQRLKVTVEKGDIIVLDTNIWYHSTSVNPGNISITIGAEYD